MSNNFIEKLLLDTENDSTLHLTCSGLTSDIINRKTTFVKLVEDLETLLTNSDLSKHNLGLDIIAQVVELLPRNFLTTTEIAFIAQFFCGQIKLHHSFISFGLRGLNALVTNEELSQQSLHEITSTLFNNVIWQTQRLADRRTFYSILQYIVVNRLQDYASVSSEFLFSIISSLDGERDPRNLLLLFSFLPTLFTSIPLGPLTEDAFEVVSCYFPIDFHSSGSGPGVVTRDDLVSALTPCLLAVPEFANFCIPLIQEKLDSTLKSAKLDSYNLLMEGCKVWPTENIVSHCEVLWLAVKQDTLPPRDAQVADCATQTLEALVKAVPEPALTQLLNSLIRSCAMFLSDVQLSLFDPSTRLLLAAMQASPQSCKFVWEKLLPGLVSLLRVTPDTSKVLVINKLAEFIQVCLRSNLDFDSAGEINDWRSLHTELQHCSEQGPAELQQAAFTTLALITAYLDIDCRLKLYPALLKHLTANTTTQLLRTACVRCLLALASIYGDEVQTNIVDNLIVNQGEDEDLVLKQHKFESVCSLALVDRFHPVLEQQFRSLVSQGPAQTSVAISCVRNLLENGEVQSNSALLRFLFSQSSLLSTLVNLSTDGEDLLNSAKIIQILVRLQNSSEQQRVVKPLVECLLQRLDQDQQMVFLESLLGSLWPDITVLSLEEISKVIVPAALKSLDNSLSQRSALQLLSTLINKSSDDNLLELVSQQLQHCPVELATTVRAYITKALVLRGHPQMEHWLNKLVDLLDNEVVAQTAANGIQLIVEQSEGFLQYENHCIVRLLYCQRVYHLVTPRLVRSTHQLSHLKALASLLQAVPHTVYVHHIKEIMPLLVKSLDTDCERLLLTVLRTLASLLSTSDPCLQEHLDTLIPRLLHLARHYPLMQVRIASLQCLYNTLKYSPILLLPHKQQVVMELLHCLDDKKRLVRKEAARTRSRWFLLGAPIADS